MTDKYNKVLAIGDPMLGNLLNGRIEITEKVDGSQYRLQMENGIITDASKGQEFGGETSSNNNMFAKIRNIINTEDMKKRLQNVMMEASAVIVEN